MVSGEDYCNTSPSLASGKGELSNRPGALNSQWKVPMIIKKTMFPTRASHCTRTRRSTVNRGTPIRLGTMNHNYGSSTRRRTTIRDTPTRRGTTIHGTLTRRGTMF